MHTLILIGSILLLLLFILLYTLSCYYVGLKGKKFFSFENKKFRTFIYWIVFWFLSFSYILSVILRNFLSVNNLILEILTSISVLSLVIIGYLILAFLICDLLKFVLKKAGFKGRLKNHMSKLYGNGISVLLTVILLIIFGMWNAANPVVTTYNIKINKYAGKLKSLNIVMISDVHIGIGIKEKGINKMITSINKLQPDIVFFCGDIADENTPSKLKKYFGYAAKNIKSKYGTYAITGNHEYYEDNLPETLHYMKAGNIKYLQDKTVKIANSFYVVGRNDVSSKRIMNKPVMTLSKLLKNVNMSLPIIVLNHQPTNLKEPEKAKIDLQLSGHTHNGQCFPNNFTTRLMYDDSYGYLKKGAFNIVVTSGYGTWGPPVRIGTKGEIANIKLKFR